MHLRFNKSQTMRDVLYAPGLRRGPTRVPRLDWENARPCTCNALEAQWAKWQFWNWCEAGEDDEALRQISCTGWVMRFYDGLRESKGPRVPKLLDMTPREATKAIMRMLKKYQPWEDISQARTVQPGDLIVCQSYSGLPVHSMIVSTTPRHIWHCTEPIGTNESHFVLPPGSTIWRILRAEDRELWA